MMSVRFFSSTDLNTSSKSATASGKRREKLRLVQHAIEERTETPRADGTTGLRGGRVAGTLRRFRHTNPRTGKRRAYKNPSYTHVNVVTPVHTRNGTRGTKVAPRMPLALRLLGTQWLHMLMLSTFKHREQGRGLTTHKKSERGGGDRSTWTIVDRGEPPTHGSKLPYTIHLFRASRYHGSPSTSCL